MLVILICLKIKEHTKTVILKIKIRSLNKVILDQITITKLK